MGLSLIYSLLVSTAIFLVLVAANVEWKWYGFLGVGMLCGVFVAVLVELFDR